MALRIYPHFVICDVNTSPPLLQPLRIKMPRGKVLYMSVKPSTTIANVREFVRDKEGQTDIKLQYGRAT